MSPEFWLLLGGEVLTAIGLLVTVTNHIAKIKEDVRSHAAQAKANHDLGQQVRDQHDRRISNLERANELLVDKVGEMAKGIAILVERTKHLGDDR